MMGKNTLTVLGVFVGALLLIAALAAFAVAKTGLVRVPFFSMFYHGPAPTRVVTSEPISEDAFRSFLTQQVARQFAAGNRTSATITIPEAELTGAVQAAITQALREQDATAEHVQIVIEPNGIEVSGRVIQRKTVADLLVRLVPVIENGGIRFDATAVRLGDYPIHPALAHRLAGAVLSRDFGTWRVSFGDVRFTSLTLRSGALELKATPNAP